MEGKIIFPNPLFYDKIVKVSKIRVCINCKNGEIAMRAYFTSAAYGPEQTACGMAWGLMDG